MSETRIKISSILENQLPQFVKEEFPLVSEFLSQYYIAMENQGGVTDLLQNIDQYIKVDSLTNLIESTILTSDVSFADSTINVESTAGFPDTYGLLLIDDEVITYTSKTTGSFEGCIRGFSGITSYQDKKDELVFTQSEVNEHLENTKVVNLSILFLKEFLSKVKKQFTPGFENRELYSEVNENIFIKQSLNFYSSKGTDRSFKILFKALYGEDVQVIKPRDYLLEPSNAQYRITSNLVVESISGDVESLVNGTLYQDKTDFIDQAQGTITNIERIRRNSKNYYIISLDYDYDKDIKPTGTVLGEFTIHPKTKVVSDIPSGSTTLEVDSTVSFPNQNGNLIINLDNGTTLNVTYSTKTLNQFLGCSGISQDIPNSTEIKYNSYAFGYSPDGTEVRIRILGVLSDLKIPDNTTLFSKNDVVKIKTLGINLEDLKYNNWFFNISTQYKVSSLELRDASDKTYKVNTLNEHSFKIGDVVTLVELPNKYVGDVTFVNNEKSFTVQLGSEVPLLDLNRSYFAQKNLNKVKSSNYENINQYTSNVQNVYFDSEDNSFYVASPSLPSYLKAPLEVNDRSVKFDGTIGSKILKSIKVHGLYTGDSLVYNPTSGNPFGINKGIYFVKKVDEYTIKLSRSRSNIFTSIGDENFVTINQTSSSVEFQLTEFTYRNLTPQVLESQKLIRKISSPVSDGTTYETSPGLTGIFINGVELLNYKSYDNVYYGEIEEIIPTSEGTGYDVINPPVLEISDSIGIGGSGYCSINGKLERIDILDPGFDYLEEPKIVISGGNGYNASAKANLVSFDHEVSFNPESNSNLIKLNPVNSIGFSTYHKFRNNEEVIYITNGGSSVGGLSTNSSYVVSVIDDYKIKLYKSVSDSISGINTIPLNSYGTGTHTFRSKNKKKKIGSISIENSGENYQNKLTEVVPSGINVASDIITIKNHGYSSGELITYYATETPIGGLSSSSTYYVTRIDDDQFKLSQLSSGITTSFYYDSKQYVNLTSTGTGKHRFNYPQINVSVFGAVGVNTSITQYYNAVLQPIFRGQIQSVFVYNGGEKYGSEDILNYNRQPLFDLNSGRFVDLSPIISNGQIVDVLINNPGVGYNSPPDIQVNGSGIGAIIVPILSSGSIVDVKIVYGGIGYEPKNTSIDVIPSGSSAKFEAKIKSWKINLVQRLLQNKQIPNDDGILTAGTNSEYGLQYSHAYAPKYLRSSVQGTTFIDGKKVYSADLQLVNGIEVLSTAHSPIIGWAYDGNPIYGPYGYKNQNDPGVKLLKSGYDLKDTLPENRPSKSIYAPGFFVDDYTYNANGDLDEHNGRFCATPEYPNGVYAYFTTVEGSENYKTPVFPYVIGDTYKSKPIEFNFKNISNQDEIDINKTNWLRNTTPYNILENNISYEYLLDFEDIKNQNSRVKNVSVGSLESIEVIDGGQDYKVNDVVKFTSNSGEFKAFGKVSLIKGKSVNEISVSILSYDDVILFPYENEFIGLTTVPHGYSNGDLITFTGKYDYKKTAQITVSNNNLLLTSGVGTAYSTGIVTYFNVSGDLSNFSIKENDIYQIGNELVKILNVDRDSSRIKVLRNQTGTTGIGSYSAGIALTERSRKFKINFGISTSYSFNLNKEIYFDPKESVGLGTTSGVGIVSTLYFSSPGVGVTQIAIPTQSIYIKNHDLKTGDRLIYSSNGGSAISVSTNGSAVFSIPNNSFVYVAKISNDLIGISTSRVGVSSTGTFISDSGGILYFNSVGSGSTHSFKTDYSNIFSGSISKNIVTVSTAETHGLSLKDNVIINAKSGISTTIKIVYNDQNRRLVVNPRTFSVIDIENNIIFVPNHNYYTGQKIICNTNVSISGLSSGIYYVVVIDSNNIRLATTYFDATKNNPNVVGIASTGSGTISEINPLIKAIKNQPLIFDLSDSSLSFVNNLNSYPAFEFKIYKDSQFRNEFNTTETTSTFEVSGIGTIGITSTAKVILNYNSNVPDVLYYNLIPINSKLNSQSKLGIFTDNEVDGSNKIAFTESLYNGSYSISGITSNTFNYNLPTVPENLSYSDNVEYYTNSTNASGPIHKVFLSGRGKYLQLPKVDSIISTSGKNAKLSPTTSTIGKINSVEIEDIGYNYSSDFSIRPTAKYPEVLKIKSLNTLDYIGISSGGKNYIFAPNIILIDGLTNEIVSDVDFKYSLGDSKVTILKNSKLLSDYSPRVIPVNNSNGIKIKNITFNNTTKDVVVGFAASFNSISEFPFKVGDKVFVEGISVGMASTEKGYNSSNYGYSFFVVKNSYPAAGGIGASITYNISEFLEDGETPGTFSSLYSSGRVIPESYLPIFNPVLKQNEFIVGETVSSNSSTGIVENWDPGNNYLKVSTNVNFNKDAYIMGETSGSLGVIQDVIRTDSEYTIKSFSTSKKTWNKETGFLNNDFQRVHDNDYYQYFSYSLRSKKDYSQWNDAVSSLNHTSGFKKFANVIVESDPKVLGINTIQNSGDFSGIVDYSEVINLNCINNFDLVRENNLVIDENTGSSEIYFRSRIIQDFIESIGNKVLTIDDISDEFNSNPRGEEYSVVDTFTIGDYRSIKYLILARDKNSIDLNYNQLTFVSLIYNDSYGFLNQYGVETTDDLGFYDFDIFGDQARLLFYPVNPIFNDYDIKVLSFNFNDIYDTNLSGISSISLGDSVNISTNSVTVPTGTSSPVKIVGIATTYRSAKVLVQIGSTTSSYYAFDEITYIHDGSEVYISNYGQLTTDKLSSVSSSGFGTITSYISGSEVVINLTPNSTTTVDYEIKTFNISISSSISSGIGTQVVGNCSINSSSTGISSSISPISNVIARYSNNDYRGSYYIISVEDLTNSDYQISELLSITNQEGCSYTEYCIMQSNSIIGIVTCGVVGSETEIYFTPDENIDVDVKVFQANIGFDSIISNVDLVDGSINSLSETYIGTKNDVRKDFNLTYNNVPVFQKCFDSENPSVVNIVNNTIKIPNHFYTTGEEIVYTYPGYGTTQAIGIASTSIPGIGLTDKLPSSLYVVKINNLDIRVAASASEALKTTPNVLQLTSTGIGTCHTFTAKNQNTKAIISIDNNIQSPIVSSSTTSHLISNVSIFNTQLFVSDTKPFRGGDLIQINDEIMKIKFISSITPNSIIVNRGLLGSGIGIHSISNVVTKVQGNYNIKDNRIYFIEAPYGQTPLSGEIDRPDEIDWVGITTGSSFSGRVFLRSGIPNTVYPAYSTNYIFDDISNEFNGKNKSFILKNKGANISGMSTDNAIVLINEIFQTPNSYSTVNNYELGESAGITSITFSGSEYAVKYDVNTSSVPRGGIILSVASTQGFGYQPLVSAGGTAIVSSAGTIQSISIGNSGSGYRPGIQKVVNVGVKTEFLESSNIHYVGIASISNGRIVGVSITNPGYGYTSSNPPIVVFDAPLSYSNIPLIYSSSSSGIGTEASVDIIVGQGSSVVSFELKNFGYSYKRNDILTVSVGGTTGIPTNTSSPFVQFSLTVDEIDSDKFSGWSLGNLQVVDPIGPLFDGFRKTFPINVDGSRVTIKSKPGSNISNFDLQASLIVFINDILQVPGVGYIFDGGSVIRFPEAPRSEDTCSILLYKGTSEVDTQNSDILETIKIGDKVSIISDNPDLTENDRLVENILSSDSIETDLYFGPGITKNTELLRPLVWCKQTEDLIINGNKVGKDRVVYEPYIYPSTNIIKNVGINTGFIFVENVKTFFDSDMEYIKNGIAEIPQNKIIIVSQESLVSASATAIVSSGGTITSVVFSENGVGYSTSPTVYISNPGIGSTGVAILTANISGGSVSSINIVSGGVGYDPLYPPSILFETPTIKYDIIDNVTYEGDFGIITGINTISVGVASTGLVFDLFIPPNSSLRNSKIVKVGIATTGISGIQTGYYFAVKGSNVGNGLTSLNSDGSILGINTNFIDNIYQVASVSIGQTIVAGIGLTNVTKVIVSVSNYNGLSGFGFSSFYGFYSWGKISTPTKSNLNTFSSYTNTTGISTFPIVKRVNRLKYLNFNT